MRLVGISSAGGAVAEKRSKDGQRKRHHDKSRYADGNPTKPALIEERCRGVRRVEFFEFVELIVVVILELVGLVVFWLVYFRLVVYPVGVFGLRLDVLCSLDGDAFELAAASDGGNDADLVA
ncbi:MAG: hypothetical protein O2826_12250 [Chloroflexi bacterium]|nr:hypothetical protein [Chloroflexota bacterium]MDA1175269.1 hypothetical protein [Chloroflexota bacterium]